MHRTTLATLLFGLLYGLTLRLYRRMRVARDNRRWHPGALLLAAFLGGVAFYSAQQLRAPRAPTWLDVPAFAILMIAAGTIPGLLELATVLGARMATRESLRTGGKPPAAPGEAADPPAKIPQ